MNVALKLIRNFELHWCCERAYVELAAATALDLPQYVVRFGAGIISANEDQVQGWRRHLVARLHAARKAGLSWAEAAASVKEHSI
jgi:hypothetical protein